MDVFGDRLFGGYTRDESWNGWACPYFTYDEAIRVVEAHRECGGEAWYEATQDSFIFTVEASDENDSFPAVEIEGHRLYPVGAFCWIWEEYSPERARGLGEGIV